MLRRLRAVLSTSHPGPTAVVTAVAVLLAVTVGYPPGRLVVLAAVVATGQLSIGWSNDWLDVQRDRSVARADKALARGDVPVALVSALACAALVVSLALGVLLGLAAAALNALIVVAGWSYNLWLKRTIISVVPYLVAFGALPALVSLGLPAGLPAAWVVAAGALLGAAAHITNALPDLDDDARTRVHGLPHRLGTRWGSVTAFACLALSAILIVVGSGSTVLMLVAGALGVALSLVGGAIGMRSKPTRLLMRLVMSVALIDVALLALAGTTLIA